MIYLRNNNSIIDVINGVNFYKLNPLYWIEIMETRYLNYLKNEPVPTPRYILDEGMMYGYGAPPEKYYVNTTSNNVFLYIEKPQKISWYSLSDPNTVITDEFLSNPEGNYPCVAVVSAYMNINNEWKLKGNRIKYTDDPHEVIINFQNLCDKNLNQKTRCIDIAFYDKYGIPQTSYLYLGEYSMSSSFDNDFMSINYGLKYYTDIVPFSGFTVGEDLIKPEFRNFYEALCINNPILVFKKEWLKENNPEVVWGSLYDTSLTAEYYGKNLSFAGTLNLKCDLDYDSIIL